MKYFKPEEFACKCGCGASYIIPELLHKLDFARGIAKIPFIITSAHRCSAHNVKVGGVGSSSHLHGFAADISCPMPTDRWIIEDALKTASITRIGHYPWGIHCDVDVTKPQNCMWVGK